MTVNELLQLLHKANDEMYRAIGDTKVEVIAFLAVLLVVGWGFKAKRAARETELREKLAQERERDRRGPHLPVMCRQRA
jgi:hypothetical protein